MLSWEIIFANSLPTTHQPQPTNLQPPTPNFRALFGVITFGVDKMAVVTDIICFGSVFAIMKENEKNNNKNILS